MHLRVRRVTDMVSGGAAKRPLSSARDGVTAARVVAGVAECVTHDLSPTTCKTHTVEVPRVSARACRMRSRTRQQVVQSTDQKSNACATKITSRACEGLLWRLTSRHDSKRLLVRPLTFPAQPFLLRAELAGHTEDVRAVVVAGALGIATCSRDKTLRLWPFPAAPGARVTDSGSRVFVAHTNFVTALAWAPPGALPVAPEGALVTASRDGDVIVWHTDAAQPLQRLSGHKQQARTPGVARELATAAL